MLLFVGLYGFLVILFYKILRIEQKVGAVGMRVGYYEPAITLWKFIQQLIFGFVSFLIVEFVVARYFIDIQVELKMIGMIFLIAILNALFNYLKHR